MTTLALLHTSPVHVPVFDALRDEDAPGLELRHLVDEQLLSRARELGPDAVAEAVRAVLTDAVAQGADAVLCTCSTIGAVAEAAAASLGVPVLRVDRPMASAAVALGHRIAVVAALASTLEPTAALIREESDARTPATAPEHGDQPPALATGPGAQRRARGADADIPAPPGHAAIPAPPGHVGPAHPPSSEHAPAPAHAPAAVRATASSPVLRLVLADRAWQHFEAGDPRAYHDEIARTVDALCDVDVVVLAQASMAPAAALTTLGVPVLASPRLGLRAAADLARSYGAHRTGPRQAQVPKA
ncbi:aspartate/glutamate racemase family protein [Streptomyces sp. NPDC006704]|uniref:aspartate/glutamate racemase family protein n=1 Tax=Streptomyces sp. NPDC006704 TaxID=3364760 RepID=UPI00369A2184